MKLLLFILVTIAIVSAFPAEKKVTCVPGPFMKDGKLCHCASDGIHHSCPTGNSLPREEGVMDSCVMGPFSKDGRTCHCASDGRHYLCPATDEAAL